MEKLKSYQLKEIRQNLIALLSANLDKSSKWYKDDYDNIVKAVNSKTMSELVESYNRQLALKGLTEYEIKRHCIV